MSPYACPSVPSLQPARSVEVSAHPLNTAEISLCRSSTSLHMSHGRGLGPEIILPENDVGTVVARSFIGPDSCLKMVPHSTYLSVDSRKSHPFPNTPFATECFYWHGCHMLCLPYIVQRSTLFPSFSSPKWVNVNRRISPSPPAKSTLDMEVLPCCTTRVID